MSNSSRRGNYLRSRNSGLPDEVSGSKYFDWSALATDCRRNLLVIVFVVAVAAVAAAVAVVAVVTVVAL